MTAMVSAHAMTFSAAASGAVRFWERGRILYNAVLAAATAAVYFGAPIADRQPFSIEFATVFFVLAVVANVLYCFAYAVDLFLQYTVYREQVRLVRPAVLAIGIAFAAAITWPVAAHIFLVQPF